MEKPTERGIQNAMGIFRQAWSPQFRDEALTALLSVKASRSIEGISAVLDPRFAQVMEQVITDEVALDATIEALRRLHDEEKQKQKGFFGFLKR